MPQCDSLPRTRGDERQEFSFSHGQTAALAALETSRLSGKDWAFTLSGYAGTGKTTVIAHYANVLTRMGLRVAISAPTNKATRVLMKKIGRDSGMEFSSIHSILGLRMDEKEDGSQDCIRKAEPRLSTYHVVIIDECSMIPEWMFEDIRANRRETFIIFVGDPYQLPPVDTHIDRQHKDPARVSPTFVQIPGKTQFTLSEIVRQAADNPIIALSMAIREAESQRRRFTPEHIARFVTERADARLFLIHREDITHLGVQEIQDAMASGVKDLPVRIVAWRNAKVQEYNHKMHLALFGDSTPDGADFAPGEPILVHQEFEALIISKGTPVYDPALRQVVMKPTPLGRVRIITSEEGIISALSRENHPEHPQIDSWQIEFRPQDEPLQVSAFVPVDQSAFRRVIDQRWTDYRGMKLKQSQAGLQLKILEKECPTDPQLTFRQKQYAEMARSTAVFSGQTWAIHKAHAQIRHGFASTAHKSQGSTWETTIVDIADLNNMPNDSDYNRALYVAVTRSSLKLAIGM